MRQEGRPERNRVVKQPADATNYRSHTPDDCAAKIVDGPQVEPASEKPCSSGVPLSTIARSGSDARIAHHGPGECAQHKGRIYVSSRAYRQKRKMLAKREESIYGWSLAESGDSAHGLPGCMRQIPLPQPPGVQTGCPADLSSSIRATFLVRDFHGNG